METLSDICSHVEPFEASLGEMETFIPATPTVFIRICHSAQRLRDLHDQLNTGGLSYKEEWPYMPHMTIIKVGIRGASAEGLPHGPQALGLFPATRAPSRSKSSLSSAKSATIVGSISPLSRLVRSWSPLTDAS